MQLSKRLQAVADLVSKWDCIADIGTDHGYIPIYLIQDGRCKRALAMDVKKGPLSRAEEHIEQFGLGEVITTRLSDGVMALNKGEADAIIVAGMGGNLVIHILEDGAAILETVKECILQPQSELEKVRRYLREHGYKIVQEDMVFEDGKYYPMMRVVHTDEEQEGNVLFDKYGEYLLKGKNSVLLQYLEYQLPKKEQILKGILKNAESHEERICELQQEIASMQEAIKYIKE